MCHLAGVEVRSSIRRLSLCTLVAIWLAPGIAQSGIYEAKYLIVEKQQTQVRSMEASFLLDVTADRKNDLHIKIKDFQLKDSKDGLPREVLPKKVIGMLGSAGVKVDRDDSGRVSTVEITVGNENFQTEDFRRVKKQRDAGPVAEAAAGWLAEYLRFIVLDRPFNEKQIPTAFEARGPRREGEAFYSFDLPWQFLRIQNPKLVSPAVEYLSVLRSQSASGTDHVVGWALIKAESQPREMFGTQTLTTWSSITTESGANPVVKQCEFWLTAR